MYSYVTVSLHFGLVDPLVPSTLLDVHFLKGRESQDMLNVIFLFNFY